MQAPPERDVLASDLLGELVQASTIELIEEFGKLPLADTTEACFVASTHFECF